MDYVWNKVNEFLYELRCEDTNCIGRVHLEKCSREKNILKIKVEKYYGILKKISESDRKIIQQYVEQMQLVAFEEQQEVYCQGIIDCIQIMIGMGLIKSDRNILTLIEDIKKPVRYNCKNYED